MVARPSFLMLEQAGRLRALAARRGVSLGQMVRQALSRELGDENDGRRRAAEELFAVGAPVADWDELEREIEAARSPCAD